MVAAEVHLPRLSDAEKRAVVDFFNAMITTMTLTQKSSAAWSRTWLATRDRHANPVLEQIEWLGRFE